MLLRTTDGGGWGESLTLPKESRLQNWWVKVSSEDIGDREWNNISFQITRHVNPKVSDGVTIVTPLKDQPCLSALFRSCAWKTLAFFLWDKQKFAIQEVKSFCSSAYTDCGLFASHFQGWNSLTHLIAVMLCTTIKLSFFLSLSYTLLPSSNWQYRFYMHAWRVTKIWQEVTSELLKKFFHLKEDSFELFPHFLLKHACVWLSHGINWTSPVHTFCECVVRSVPGLGSHSICVIMTHEATSTLQSALPSSMIASSFQGGETLLWG